MQRGFLFAFGRKDSTRGGGEETRRPDLKKKREAKQTAVYLCAGQVAPKAAPEMDSQHTDHYKQH
jgi:hypothetical protein